MKKSFRISGLVMFALLGGCAVDSTSGEQGLKDDSAPVDGADAPEPAGSEEVGEQSQALAGDFWVGVMMVGSTCPVGTSKVSFYLDMEDSGISAGDFTNWIYGFNSDYTERNAATASGNDLRGSGFRFNWCRVDGEKFKPLTTDAFDYENFYSVLKLSANCPPGSQERGIYIDTEDDDPSNSSSGNISPNVVGANATLKFCQFSAGASKMSSFPSFKDANGAPVPYSVLHDFSDTSQPSWVLNKKYVYFDDEDDGCTSKYLQAKPSPLLAFDPYATFTSAVQRASRNGGDWGTYFEFAQVK